MLQPDKKTALVSRHRMAYREIGEGNPIVFTDDGLTGGFFDDHGRFSGDDIAASVFAHNIAKLSFARAIGGASDQITEFVAVK
jgi:hypothetical protein